MSTANLFDEIADVGSEEDEDFDEEGGEVRPRKTNGTNGMDDSSEEEDEDDDELLAQASFRIQGANCADELTLNRKAQASL
jgi:transcription elongation factor SPT6